MPTIIATVDQYGSEWNYAMRVGNVHPQHSGTYFWAEGRTTSPQEIAFRMEATLFSNPNAGGAATTVTLRGVPQSGPQFVFETGFLNPDWNNLYRNLIAGEQATLRIDYNGDEIDPITDLNNPPAQNRRDVISFQFLNELNH